MTRLMRLAVGGCLGMLTLLAPLGAQQNAGPHRVQDDAGLFSQAAEDKANAQIAHIKKTYGKDVVVETIPRLDFPAGVNKDDFFARWVEERFNRQHINGVYVVIVKEPGKLRVETGPETRKLGFFSREREKMLASALLEDLKAKQFDLALDRAVNDVAEGFAAHSPAKGSTSPHRPSPAPAPKNDVEVSPLFGWLCVGIAVLLGVWLLFGILRAIGSMFSGRSGSYGPGYGQGGGYGPGPGYAPGYGGGGGFFSNLLGGMFGAAAGMWMYNNFFGGHAHGGYTQPPPSGIDYGNPGSIPSDVGSTGTPTGSGGDWDSSGGTQDVGGGGSGGDWGSSGTDSTSTGGDWGSSGGDTGGGFSGGDAGSGGDW